MAGKKETFIGNIFHFFLYQKQKERKKFSGKGLSQNFYPANFCEKTKSRLRMQLELRNPTHKKLARLEVSKSVQIAILCPKIAKMILKHDYATKTRKYSRTRAISIG